MPVGGYYVWKNYAQWETNFNNGALNTSDKPIFKIEEVLLNYAECKWEQGQFNQSIADKTINKLRERADMAPMIVAEIDDNFDPERDQTVDPVLWEIRRERMIELMGEGFGFDDVRRWKKLLGILTGNNWGCGYNNRKYKNHCGMRQPTFRQNRKQKDIFIYGQIL